VRSDPLFLRLATVAHLREEDKQLLNELCGDVRTVAAKHDIISQGDRPDYVHLIMDGWAGRYKLVAGGARQIVAFLIPGDFCDLHVAVLGHMDHGIVALTKCRVAYIVSRDLDELTSHHNGLTKALWWSTLVDEAVLRSWVVNAGRRTAYERIAHLFCEMHLRMSLVGLVDGNRFDMPITQEELADATALTPVHVNRTLQVLRNDGLIKFRGGVLTVLDVPRLQKEAGFDADYLHLQRRRPNGAA
jgi:CRP-like cAMP-binding protein